MREVPGVNRTVCRVVPVDEQTHELELQLAERYRLSIHGSMIPAAARLTCCTAMLSNDMQDGQILAGLLDLRNPFA